VGFLEVGLRSHADGCNPSRPVGYIEGWYVTEDHRRCGVGRNLLAKAEAARLGDFTAPRKRVLTLRFRSLGERLAPGVGASEEVVIRFADDTIVGFQYRTDADRFLEKLRERLAMFGLELHTDKTRRIEFGRFAEENRNEEEKESRGRSTFWASRTSAGRTDWGDSRCDA